MPNEGSFQEFATRDALAVVGACVIDQRGQQRCFEPPPDPGSRGIRVPKVQPARPPLGYGVSDEQIHVARIDAVQHVTMPCVLRVDGTVGCWSKDSHVPRFGAQPSRDGLLTVEGIAEAEQIAAGRDFLCARLRGGRLTCTASPRPRTPQIEAPRGLDAIDDAVHVVAGDAHACARRADGAVVCWGANNAGQLGAGTFEPREDVVAVPDLRAVELAAGQVHTCARTAEGEVWCWGLGEAGQLGDRFTPRWRRDFASTVPGLPEIAEVVLLPGRTCARDVEGSVWCWGDGARSTTARPSCRPGDDGALVCTPQGGGGSACGGRRFGQRLDRARPRRLDGVTVRDVATSGAQLLALDGRGRILALGTLTPCTHRQDVLRVEPRVVATVPGAVELAAGSTICARTEAGAVHCSTTTDPSSEHWLDTTDLALTPVPELDEVIGLALGFAHACALRQDGTVACWGEGPSGQLGHGTAEGSSGPVDVVGLHDAVELTAGWFHTCARRSDGTVACWGENEGGALGDGTADDRARPTAVIELGEARSVAALGWQTCAWHDRGRISCWGTRPIGGHEPLTRPRDVTTLPVE